MAWVGNSAGYPCHRRGAYWVSAALQLHRPGNPRIVFVYTAADIHFPCLVGWPYRRGPHTVPAISTGIRRSSTASMPVLCPFHHHDSQRLRTHGCVSVLGYSRTGRILIAHFASGGGRSLGINVSGSPEIRWRRLTMRCTCRRTYLSWSLHMQPPSQILAQVS